LRNDGDGGSMSLDCTRTGIRNEKNEQGTLYVIMLSQWHCT